MPSCDEEKLQRCLLQTIAYSDIFDYPLKEKEVWHWLVFPSDLSLKLPSKLSLRKSLEELLKTGLLETKKGFFFLPGRQQLVALREEKKSLSGAKMKVACKATERLRLIPGIKMIGITGALAMENCQENDDVDLLVITWANCLWLTRLLIILLSPFLGIKRRRPGEKNTKDKICFNLFLDESHLKIQSENLFLAHEICQVKPVLSKDKTYEKFLWENRWVSNFLPNAAVINNVTRKQSNNRSFIASLLCCFIAIFEKIAFYLQYFYMKPK
ncbi:MAG: hypothetical protein ACPLY7_01650, partial [Microgenomates group bacterium]